jgi:hypothetical protein
MAYGHAERNLALIRQLEAETAQLLGDVAETDPEQSAWLRDVAGQGKPTVTSAASQGRQPPPSPTAYAPGFVSRGDSAANSAGCCSTVRTLASGATAGRRQRSPRPCPRGRVRRER